MYFRARYYDPRLGRFVSRDPKGVWGDAAQLGNGQSAFGNNPVNRGDPFGKQDTATPSSPTTTAPMPGGKEHKLGVERGTAAADLGGWADDLKAAGFPDKWMRDLTEKKVPIVEDTTGWLQKGVPSEFGGYDRKGENLVFTKRFFNPKTGKLMTATEMLKCGDPNKYNMVAAVIQESFHAWFDLVAGKNWWFVDKDEEEELSSYIQDLIENWLRIRDNVKCGATDKATAKKLWDAAKSNAQARVSNKKLIDRLKGDLGDFEAIDPY